MAAMAVLTAPQASCSRTCNRLQGRVGPGALLRVPGNSSFTAGSTRQHRGEFAFAGGHMLPPPPPIYPALI